MPRLSRAESQVATREKLLRTARESFLRDGYTATSLAAVAERAGYSTGAVYSNFGGKAELALQVLEEIQSEQLGELERILAAPEPVDARLTALEHWAAQAMASGWPRLELEFALDARTHPSLVRAEAARQRSAAAAIARAIEQQLGPLGLDQHLPVRELAEAAVNLGIGLAIRRMIDPTVSPSSLTTLLRRTLLP